MSSSTPSSSSSLPVWSNVYRVASILKSWNSVLGNKSKEEEWRRISGINGMVDSKSIEGSAMCQFWLKESMELDQLLNYFSPFFPSTPTGLRWDYSDSELTSLASEIVKRTNRVLNGIATIKPGQHTFENTIGALNDNDRIVDVWSTNMSFLGHVSGNKSLRDVATDLSKVLSEYEVAQSMKLDVYESFKAFSETSEAKSLKGEKARLLEFTLRDFKRNGLNLPVEKRDRVEAIKKRISTIGITFSKNVAEENTKFELTAAELSGLPADQLSRFPKSETDPSKYVVSLKYPSYFPTIENCTVS
jgi:Zn-dependent oligopeptidase